jgi:hypothetical protein
MENKQRIRPILTNILSTEKSSEIETFQNLSLRPIIKLQHSILIAFFKEHVLSRKTNFDNISKEKAFLFIENALSKDARLKNKLVGIIIGLFTLEEFNGYLVNSSEYNKRILSILKKRFKDSLLELQ